jgi:hypothetical protein
MSDYYADVDILVNGKPIKKFAHQGKLFIQSNHQVEYSLRLKNKGWSRRLFVITVDGINVIDGKAGGSSQMGYIIAGNSSMEVKGFRTDNQTEHPFKFSSKRRSYAAKSEETQGDTTNCGVIGVTVYDEYIKPTPIVVYHNPPPPPPKPFWWLGDPLWNHNPTWTSNTYAVSGSLTRSANDTTSWSSSGPTYGCKIENSMGHQLRSFQGGGGAQSSASNCMAEEPVANFDMGTEFSKEKVYSPVNEVPFEVGTALTSILIYYASREALLDMGVPVVKEVQIPSFPQAFPSKFCKPPRS